MAQVRPALTDAQRAEVRSYYVAHTEATVDQLAAAYGVSRATMIRALRGVARRQGARPAPVSTARLRQMHEAGVSMAQIGKQVGLSESGVWRRLNREQEVGR